MTARQLFISPIAGWLNRVWTDRKIAHYESTLEAVAHAQAQAHKFMADANREQRSIQRKLIVLRADRRSM